MPEYIVYVCSYCKKAQIHESRVKGSSLFTCRMCNKRNYKDKVKVLGSFLKPLDARHEMNKFNIRKSDLSQDFKEYLINK